ncbi:hypothetical protein NW762_011556 [Fusarium torreyae]|uniref:Xylanolytic transcriptional activator regulatory domain-containing protein n=1 Tax=Fusarium torreyae TaxID=1237075 RepID=A0A9W8V9H1_9HYPO|nr:hypothetical protein NW762_011556 [Fusarium torreyae]
MNKEDQQLLLKVLDYQRIPLATLGRDLRPSQKVQDHSVPKRPGPQVRPPSPSGSKSDEHSAPQQDDHTDSFSISVTAENETNINDYPATDIQAPGPFYQEVWDTSEGNSSDLTARYTDGDNAGIRPCIQQGFPEFSSPYTENKSTGQTDETEALIDQLSERIGTLQVGAGGHIRYYGPTSNFNLAQLPFPDVFTVRRTIRNDGTELLERLGLHKPIPAALKEHLIQLYFAWQDPILHIVNQHMFFLAKSRWEDGEESPYYSESLENALCALGAAFETRHHPTLITFPRSLAEFFADRAKGLLEIELDNPCVATVQALAVLSSHDIGSRRDSRGWLYSGMALRLAFDLGLHVDMASHVSQGLLGHVEAGLRREVFWGTYLIDKWEPLCNVSCRIADFDFSSWGFYLGQPFRMHTEDITVSKPRTGAYPGDSNKWFAYGVPEPIRAEASLSDSFGQLHHEQVRMAEIMAPVANIL